MPDLTLAGRTALARKDAPNTGWGEHQQVVALVIDDEDDERELVADFIRRSGYSVVTARNGKDALNLLDLYDPEIIFVDLGMPIMSGRTVPRTPTTRSATL